VLADDQLLAVLAPWMRRGQLELAHALRLILAADAPDVLALLDVADHSVFLEPTAAAYAARGSTSVADLTLAYAGAIDPDHRPERFVVNADGAARVFLPRLGYLAGGNRYASFEIHRDQRSAVGYSRTDASATATSLADWHLGDTPLTLLPYPVRALEVAVDAAGCELRGMTEAAQAHRDAVTTALRGIADTWPALGDAIEQVVRHVVLFDDPTRNSFATPSAHGIAFLNVASGTSVSFFVEDIAHQCGHAIFTAAWNGAEPLLTTPPTTGLSELTGRDDHRTLEVTLHGMVTQALMVGALARMLLSDRYAEQHETTGRLLFALLRLGVDLRAIAALDIYTDAGMTLLRELIATYQSAAERHGASLLAADFSDQPYNFDYTVYRAHNPRARTVVPT
jgi:hypothetical protein